MDGVFAKRNSDAVPVFAWGFPVGISVCERGTAGAGECGGCRGIVSGFFGGWWRDGGKQNFLWENACCYAERGDLCGDFGCDRCCGVAGVDFG